MMKGKKVVVVLPAYNAAQTLEKTYKEIPFDVVDDVVLVDDASKDKTVDIGKQLGISPEKFKRPIGNFLEISSAQAIKPSDKTRQELRALGLTDEQINARLAQ